MTYPPISRPTDPETSAESEEIITESGARTTLMEQCLEFVQRYPGHTAGEIGERTGLGHDRVWRRLSDLKNLGRIVQGPPKRWQGRSQVTWEPTERQGSLL
jgi:predicted HTH transcriptional regulator